MYLLAAKKHIHIYLPGPDQSVKGPWGKIELPLCPVDNPNLLLT